LAAACLHFCSAYLTMHDMCAKPAESPRQEQFRTSGSPIVVVVVVVSSSSSPSKQMKHIAPFGIIGVGLVAVICDDFFAVPGIDDDDDDVPVVLIVGGPPMNIR
jgi:hypothetical protein